MPLKLAILIRETLEEKNVNYDETNTYQIFFYFFKFPIHCEEVSLSYVLNLGCHQGFESAVHHQYFAKKLCGNAFI